MDSPSSRLTPLEEILPFPLDSVESESVSQSITTRSRSKKRVAPAVDPEPRPTKKPRKGTKCDHSTPSEPSGSGDGTRTPTMTAQAARRRADLVKDPHASVIDKHNVQCLKCGVKIKLSVKGSYDLHHWEKHRKRCNKWSEPYAAKKRAENCIESSRLSTPPPTPPLTEDCGTEFTGTSDRSTSLPTLSARSPTPEVALKAEKGKEPVTPTRTRGAATRESLSPAPPPPTAGVECKEEHEERRTGWPVQPRFPLSSHTQSAAAMALLHPDLEVLDLNKPLPDVPAWSWADIKPGTTVYRCTEWGRGSVLLSAADWDESESEEAGAAAGEE